MSIRAENLGVTDTTIVDGRTHSLDEQRALVTILWETSIELSQCQRSSLRLLLDHN